MNSVGVGTSFYYNEDEDWFCIFHQSAATLKYENIMKKNRTAIKFCVQRAARCDFCAFERFLISSECELIFILLLVFCILSNPYASFYP